jgi:hypothetical protein
LELHKAVWKDKQAALFLRIIVAETEIDETRVLSNYKLFWFC